MEHLNIEICRYIDGTCFIVGMGNSIKQITKIIRIIIKEMMKYF